MAVIWLRAVDAVRVPDSGIIPLARATGERMPMQNSRQPGLERTHADLVVHCLNLLVLHRRSISQSTD